MHLLFGSQTFQELMPAAALSRGCSIILAILAPVAALHSIVALLRGIGFAPQTL